jgi:acetyl esterase/lipase
VGPTTWEYAERRGFRPLEVDVWLPEPAQRAPVVVWIHGGGWLTGTRRHTPETYPQMFVQLCDAGFAVATLDYRHSAEAVFPAQLEDVTAGLDWVMAHAAEFGVDASRLALWGESAGGHLATLLALTSPPDLVKCAVPFYAPSDLTTLRAQTLAVPDRREPPPPEPESPEALLIGGPPTLIPEKARAASPITYAHPGAPPMLLLHGTADQVVPYQQSEELAARLAALGADVALEPVPGADHIFAGHPDPTALIARAIEFTAHQLGVDV